MWDRLFISIAIIIGICLIPVIVYFCVKFGTVAYFKAKQFIDKEKEGDLHE